eukprot:4177763-Pleurochrysis_carterae.AAC.1
MRVHRRKRGAHLIDDDDGLGEALVELAGDGFSEKVPAETQSRQRFMTEIESAMDRACEASKADLLRSEKSGDEQADLRLERLGSALVVDFDGRLSKKAHSLAKVRWRKFPRSRNQNRKFNQRVGFANWGKGAEDRLQTEQTGVDYAHARTGSI